jgi:hypothetical protein
MRVFGNVDVDGIKLIVFNQKTVESEDDLQTIYKLKYKSEKNKSLKNAKWYRAESKRNAGTTSVLTFPYDHMAARLTRICHTKKFRVRFHGDTANVYDYGMKDND